MLNLIASIDTTFVVIFLIIVLIKLKKSISIDIFVPLFFGAISGTFGFMFLFHAFAESQLILGVILVYLCPILLSLLVFNVGSLFKFQN
jgi:hypothetical protein